MKRQIRKRRRLERFDDNDEISLLSPITNTSQNQLSHSENFAHADWVKNNCTVQGGQADPFGGNNAYKFAALDASSNSKLMDAPVAVADGDTVTFSVHAKKGELDILQLVLGNIDYAGGATHVNFNLSTGASILLTGEGSNLYNIEKYFSIREFIYL